MNATPTLIAKLPEAGLAAVTGGLGWVVSLPCMMAVAALNAFSPGLGSFLFPYCTFLI